MGRLDAFVALFQKPFDFSARMWLIRNDRIEPDRVFLNHVFLGESREESYQHQLRQETKSETAVPRDDANCSTGPPSTKSSPPVM